MIDKCQEVDAETPRPVLDGGLGVIRSPLRGECLRIERGVGVEGVEGVEGDRHPN